MKTKKSNKKRSLIDSETSLNNKETPLLNLGNTRTPMLEEVNMTSIDSYLSRMKQTQLHLLKIDTEGNDNDVLNGAKDAIRNKLGMFTFEGNIKCYLIYIYIYYILM